MNDLLNILNKAISAYQQKQDLLYEVQKLANEARTFSKRTIALLRRANNKKAKELIKKAEEKFKLINDLAQQNQGLLNQNFYKEAVEEYIEAITLYDFLTNSKREIPNFIKINSEEIISGICDFTGELLRRTRIIASLKNFDKIEEYQTLIESIASELTKIGFSGKLRQKYEEVERNLNRIEEIMYDIKLKKEKK